MKFLITAGPTHEPIDPVRYLTNRSSGKMGYALATAALRKGHRVTLISGPTHLEPSPRARMIRVKTAREMRRAVMKNFKRADIIIMSSAVADYRPKNIATRKIKKISSQLTVQLVRNPDILKEMGAEKRKSQILVGFAAETDHHIKNAQTKLRKKKCDWIIVNDVNRQDIGFESDNNAVTLISAWGVRRSFGKQSKKSLAHKIINVITMT